MTETKPNGLSDAESDAVLIERATDLQKQVLELKAESERIKADPSRAIAYPVRLARVRNNLRDFIMGPWWPTVEMLKGQEGGFGLDQGRGGQRHGTREYTQEEIANAVTSALIQGFRITDGEWMVLQGKVYPHYEGLNRVLTEVHGVRNIRPTIGNAHAKGGSWVVPCMVEYQLLDFNGRLSDVRVLSLMTDELAIQIKRKGDGDTPEGIQGKARRQLYKRLLIEVSTAMLPDEDMTEPDGVMDVPFSGPDSPPNESAPEPAQQTKQPDWDDYGQVLDAQTMVEDVRAVAQSWSADFPDQQQVLEAMAEKRCEVIRANRGGRSSQ